MDKHSCKICDKQFGNGRALGGHMRSHMAKLPLPPKPTADQREGSEEVSSEPDSDRTSDTQSWPSKRRASETASSSSATETNAAADVAEVLVMMSRDSWRARKKADHRNDGGGFRCDACGKVFRSGKALGGHKASHRRGVKGSTIFIFDDNVDDASFHECPYCFKVFGSGKALGGHKKIHLAMMNIETTASASVAVSVSASVAASAAVRCGPNPRKKRYLDLNLPPQSDEEGGDHSGHFPETSAVSYAAMDDPILR